MITTIKNRQTPSQFKQNELNKNSTIANLLPQSLHIFPISRELSRNTGKRGYRHKQADFATKMGSLG
jgi:hypothetical protein